MTGKMILRPGTPDDDNREYLPEKIKNIIFYFIFKILFKNLYFFFK